MYVVEVICIGLSPLDVSKRIESTVPGDEEAATVAGGTIGSSVVHRFMGTTAPFAGKGSAAGDKPRLVETLSKRTFECQKAVRSDPYVTRRVRHLGCDAQDRDAVRLER
jgi:hypothetical protein